VTAAGPPQAPEPLLDLQRLVVAIRRRRRMWLAAGLLGLLAGALLAFLLPARPAAVTRLLIVHEDDQSAAAGMNIQTDIALLQTARIAAATLQRLGLQERPEDFVKSYEGVALTSNVLELTVRGPTDEGAVARAQALADVFIADHVERTRAGAEADAKALLDQRDKAQAELTEVEASIAALTARDRRDNPAQVESLFARRSELTTQVSQLGRRADEAGIGAPRVAAGTQIVDAPRALPRSRLRTAVLDAGIGLLFGMAVGLAAAAVASVVRDRPVLRREIAAHLGASVIAQLATPRRAPAALRRRSRRAKERRRVAATLARAAGDDGAPVSLLALGDQRTTAALALDMAEELAADGPVVIVDELSGGRLRKLTGDDPGRPIRIMDGDGPPDAATPDADERDGGRERRLGIGSVAPGTAWTDLRRLGAETMLVVRAGRASTLWLHTVARQLAALQIPVIGVVLVDPDPGDRSDGTLWDGLHTALRGRAGRGHPADATAADATATDATPANATPTDARPANAAPAQPADRTPADAKPAHPLSGDTAPIRTRDRWQYPTPASDRNGNGVANAGTVSSDDYPTEQFAPIRPASEYRRRIP
jgi:capsular polysaccharide biosynthesis protein